MSNEVATRSPVQELVASIRTEEFREQIALALPEGMKPGRFVRVMATALLDNPDLARAEPNSVFQAGIRCAQDGLLPDGREAAFVMFGNACTYLPMIAGYRKIAAEFGWSIRTQVVHAGDDFTYSLGLEPKLEHVPARFGTDRGEPVGAYAVGRHRDGRVEVEVLTIEDIEKVRAVSRGKDRGPWKDWWERMAEKTAGRRLFAKLPLGERDRARIASVLDADDLAPGEASKLLYGREISAPVTQVPSPAGGEDGTRQAAGEVDVDEAEQAEPGASRSEAAEAPLPAAAEPVEEVEGEVVEEGEFKAPASVGGDSPEIIAANEAAEVAFESGKYKGQSLREVAGDGTDGPAYLRWVIANWKTPAFRDKVVAFCSVYVPEAVDEKEAAS